jgi:hypothetical protein
MSHDVAWIRVNSREFAWCRLGIHIALYSFSIVRRHKMITSTDRYSKRSLGILRTSRQNSFSAGPLSSFCSEGLSKDCTMQYEPSPNVTRCRMNSREFAWIRVMSQNVPINLWVSQDVAINLRMSHVTSYVTKWDFIVRNPATVLLLLASSSTIGPGSPALIATPEERGLASMYRPTIGAHTDPLSYTIIQFFHRLCPENNNTCLL